MENRELHNSKKVKLLGEGTGKDKISELCDDILIRILNFLSFKEAVRSSLISRRWQHLCDHFSGCISFEQIEPTWIYSDWDLPKPNEKCKFVGGWLNRYLNSHQASTIDEFRVHVSLDKDSKSYADKWVDFALRKKVKKLQLNLAPYPRSRCCHTWPTSIDLNEFCSLTKETFSSGVHFLTSLSLEYVGISNEILESIFSSCPLLESLDLICSSAMLVRPKVSAPRLLHLNIYCRIFSLIRIEIYAPNLVSFQYFGAISILHIKYAPKLDQLYFNDKSFNLSSHLQLSLANYLPQLVTLSMGTCYAGVPHNFPKLMSLKHLSCEAVAFYAASMRNLTSLIEAAPFLHKFKLEIRSAKEIKTIKEGELQELWTRVRDHPNKHIKEVEIIGFPENEAQAEILTYLFKNAVLLEKVVVDTSRVLIERGHYDALPRERQSRKKQMAKHIIDQHVQMQYQPGPQLFFT